MRRLLLKLRRRTRLEKELEDELAFHREMAERAGNPVPLGSPVRIKEASRDAWRFASIENVALDLVHAVRRLRKDAGFTLAVVVILALAIGVNTAILGIADAVFFRPFPYPEPERVFMLSIVDRTTGERATDNVSGELVEILNRYHEGLSRAGSLQYAQEAIPGMSVVAAAPGYFEVLGIRPERGRLFADGDIAGRAALLSHATWRSRFGADETVVGDTVTIGEQSVDVVGVLPRGFFLPALMYATDPDLVVLGDPAQSGFHPIVRLEPDVTPERAQARIDALTAPLAAVALSRESLGPGLMPVRDLIYPTREPLLRLLLACAVLVLLAGCAQITNMLLARSLARVGETGVRAALGAGRIRVVRPLVFEAILLGLGAALAAVVVTWLAFDLLLPYVPPGVYRTAPVGMSLRVAIFGLAMGVTAGLLFGVLPAWRAARLDPLAVIQRRRSGGRSRLGGPMVAVQVALSIVLVFGSIVSVRALLSVLRTPLGFDAGNVVVASVLPRGLEGTALRQFYVRAVEEIARHADVVSAGAVASLPFSGEAAVEGIANPDGSPLVGLNHVTPGYFETARIPLVAGRFPNGADLAGGETVSVLSESASRALFGAEDPIGRTYGDEQASFRVVGVVPDIVRTLDSRGFFGYPWAYVVPDQTARYFRLVVRTRTHSAAVLRSVEREVQRIAGAWPVTAEWWEDRVHAEAAFRNPRFQAFVLVGFAGLALALTGLGVAGVAAFLVAARSREMGIRLALGCRARALTALTIRQTLLPVLAGIALGLLATPALGGLAESQFFALEAPGAGTLLLTVAIALVPAVVAAWLQARRAGRIDPVSVLRAE